MKLSIVIPVYNEEKTVGEVLNRVAATKLPVKKEIIVVDDGSTDATVSVISNFTPPTGGSNFKFIKQQKNLGKGAAVLTGIEHATGEYVLIQDADLEYNPKDIVRLITPVLEERAQVVYGTRLKRFPNLLRDERTPRFLLHYIGNRFLSLLASIMYGQWITDMETGYKLFPKKIVENMRLRAKSFDFEAEITAKLLKSGTKIVEIPITTNPRDYSEGKKLNTWTDGAHALWALLKYRFTN